MGVCAVDVSPNGDSGTWYEVQAAKLCHVGGLKQTLRANRVLNCTERYLHVERHSAMAATLPVVCHTGPNLCRQKLAVTGCSSLNCSRVKAVNSTQQSQSSKVKAAKSKQQSQRAVRLASTQRFASAVRAL